MKDLPKKVASTVSGIVLFCVGCAMAGLGLTVIAFLAMFAIAAAGLAVLAAPFVALAQPEASLDEDAATTAATA